MARIRSVHPGLFTDEAWVSCSPMARLLMIGLWTDADDQGVFEWKPLQIKMRLLPGDVADVSALLAELAAVDLIQRFEADGKPYGAIHLFRKYQRPKKPNAIHPLPAAMRGYVCIDEKPKVEAEEVDTDPEPVPNQFPTASEISPQMEDGGGRREEEVSDANASSVAGKPVDPIPEAVALWNELAGRLGLPKAKTIDKARKATLRARLAEGGLETWREALAAVERSPHCRGENDRGWRADLDFVCQPRSWRRLLEGSYGGEGPAPSGMLAFTGPADVSAAVTKACGAEHAAILLNRCTWRDIPDRTLVSESGKVVDTLNRDAGKALGDLGVRVLLEKAA